MPSFQAQEDGFLGRVLVDEGQDVEVDTPVALMCELEEALKDISSNGKQIEELLQMHKQLRRLTWQSYLKEGKDRNTGCS